MRIFVAIVHHWNPDGGGRHASLRPNRESRQYALQDQLLGLRRLSIRQGLLNIAAKSVEDANQAIRHDFTIKVVTDGCHHVLDYLEPCYKEMIDEAATSPSNPLHLGFEAQRILADHLEENYDLYAYFEDDLLIHDPFFFHKIFWFQNSVGQHAVLMPNRYESFWKPVDTVDRFYIDGPMEDHELKSLIPNPPQSLSTPLPGGNITFISPSNPHSGCFVLTQSQLRHWSKQPCFQDYDCSLISPLESAATLGIVKTFTLYKPHFAYGAFLELQHWGTSFRSLIGEQIQSLK